QMDASPLSESDSEISESTRVFNLKMEKDFMKAFPLRSEQKTSMGPPTSAVRGHQTFGKTPLLRGHVTASTPHSMKPHSSSTPIKFSLDESFVTGATAQNLSSKVAELTTELDLHKRKLERQSKELATAMERMDRYKVDAEELIRSHAELKKAKQRLEDDLRGAQLMEKTDNPLNSSYCTLINKWSTWLDWKDAQMMTMAAIMADARLWTEENRTLVANSHKSTEPKTLSQDEVILCANGSVQDFHGIHELPITQLVEEEEEINPNDTTIRDDNESVFMDQSVMEEVHNDSMNQSSRSLPPQDDIESNLESSILDSTMYEKDEKIDKLEFELNKAKEQMELYKGRTTRLAVMEEENESLKHRLKYLEDMHDQSIRDLHTSERLCEDRVAATMISPDGQKMERGEARSITQIMRAMQRKIDEWEEAYRRVEGEIQMAQNEAVVAKSDAEAARAHAEQISNDVGSVLAENNTLTAQLNEVRQQLEAVNRDRVEMAPLINDTVMTENVPTDAGDTTQIVHFQFNPLDQARQELREEQEERKRSMEGGEGPSVKRSRNEEDAEMEGLRRKLQIAESRCEKLSTHNTNSIRNFRHILLKVIGYDIKMKQEDSVQLSSIYDPLNQHFGFVVRDNLVEMIELADKPFEGPVRFQEEAEMWMGERGSVPAFLAACQLKLVEGTMVEPEEETLMYHNEPDDDLDPAAGPSFSILNED
ncbi:hypothetical protein PENTCL1PPCAC_6423, partial [Pristionchus entomophagus]